MHKLELFNQGDILYGRYNQVVSPFHLAKKYVILMIVKHNDNNTKY